MEGSWQINSGDVYVWKSATTIVLLSESNSALRDYVVLPLFVVVALSLVVVGYLLCTLRSAEQAVNSYGREIIAWCSGFSDGNGAAYVFV